MPFVSDSDQMVLSGLLISWAQFFNRVAGTPSGPGAESLSSSDIAFAMSFVDFHHDSCDGTVN